MKKFIISLCLILPLYGYSYDFGEGINKDSYLDLPTSVRPLIAATVYFVSSGGCMGVAIGEHTVRTAAHCIKNLGKTYLMDNQTIFLLYFDVNTREYITVSTKVSNIEMNPDWLKQNCNLRENTKICPQYDKATFDVATQLRHPLTPEVLAAPDKSHISQTLQVPNQGMNLISVGMSKLMDEPGADKLNYIMGTVVYTKTTTTDRIAVDTTLSRTYNKITLLSTPVSYGDSGAPLFMCYFSSCSLIGTASSVEDDEFSIVSFAKLY